MNTSNLTDRPIAWKPLLYKDVPNIRILEKCTNQYLIWCPCGEYYMFDIDDTHHYEGMNCPKCGSNDHTKMRMHSGDCFNSGNF